MVDSGVDSGRLGPKLSESTLGYVIARLYLLVIMVVHGNIRVQTGFGPFGPKALRIHRRLSHRKIILARDHGCA